MWIAVVPAYNEASSIAHVINNLKKIKIDLIVIVANGCSDNTCLVVYNTCKNSPLHLLTFPQPLGVDIPRAIGVAFAKKFNPTGVLFVDGDMKGNIAAPLGQLKESIQKGLDMSLTNCYPYIYLRSELATSVLKTRENLNRKLNLFNTIGLANPCHGPHAISARFLLEIPSLVVAIPPLALAMASQKKLSINVGSAIPHFLLGSNNRSTLHGNLIAKTIIGDCLQALSYVDSSSLHAVVNNNDYFMGYRPLRRFDILKNYLDKYGIN